jgi:Flp pilus assembly pilin Flp
VPRDHGWIVNDFFNSKRSPDGLAAGFAKTPVYRLGRRFWHDQAGFVFSVEMLLLGTVIVIGLIVGHTSVRDALNCELSDIGGALQDLNQSYTSVADNSDGSTIESSFEDTRDHCDQPGDPVGAADNCIVFNVEPTDEGEFKTFEVSQVGSYDFDSVNTGFGGSASGTIGDGSLNTTFNTTTDTGQILGTSANKIRFRESPNANGTFTTTFADPLTNVELWVQNLANNDNFLGNFTVTLSDGTVLNNAAFTVLPDVITPSTDFGEFRTASTDTENLQVTTIGGNQFVTDPTSNGPRSQAAGRIVFTGVPPTGNSPTLSDPVGISSISFDRFGGPDNFSAFFGFSGQVIICDD